MEQETGKHSAEELAAQQLEGLVSRLSAATNVPPDGVRQILGELQIPSVLDDVAEQLARGRVRASDISSPESLLRLGFTLRTALSVTAL